MHMIHAHVHVHVQHVCACTSNPEPDPDPDPNPNQVTDMYFMYSEATVIEAKKVVTDVRMAGKEVAVVREDLRQQLVSSP